MPSRAYELSADVSLEHLETALRILWTRHEALRSRFTVTETGASLAIEPMTNDRVLAVFDAWLLPPEERESAAFSIIAHTSEAFAKDLARLCRPFVMLRGPDLPRLFVLVTHHLVFDKWSELVFMRELFSVHDQIAAQRHVRLPPPTTDTRTWAAVVDQCRELGAFDDEVAHWRETMRGLEQDWVGVVRPEDTIQGGFSLEVEETRALMATRRTLEVSLDDMLSAVTACALARWRKRTRVGFTWLVRGRENLPPGIDLTGTVGCLFRDWPHAIDVPTAATARDLIPLIRAQREGTAFSGLGYSVLAYGRDEELAAELRMHPARAVSANFLGDSDLFERLMPRSRHFVPVSGAALDPRVRPPKQPVEIVFNISEGRLVGGLRTSCTHEADFVDFVKTTERTVRELIA